MQKNKTPEEKEIQARVELKLNDILCHIESRCASSWNSAFATGSPVHANYWEAFKDIERIFKKEIDMGVPYDSISDKNRKEARNKAVDDVVRLFGHEAHRKIRSVVSIIEEAQNY